MTKVGGYGDEKPADDQTELIVGDASVRAAVAAAVGAPVASLVVSSYSTQVVAGLNFRIKATVNDDKKVLITAFRALPHAGGGVEVKSVEVE